MTTYRAFISYSHADAAVAKWLHRAIETYRVPRPVVAAGFPERLYPLFRDRSDMRAGADLTAALRAALLDSDALIVVCSPAAVASAYVNLEIETFARDNPGRPILALIAAGVPAVHGTGGCFPAALLAAGQKALATRRGD